MKHDLVLTIALNLFYCSSSRPNSCKQVQLYQKSSQCLHQRMSSLSHIYPVYIAGILIHIVYVMQRIKSSFNTSICKRSLPVFHQQCGSHYEHKLIMLFLTWAQFQFDHDMTNNGTNRGNFTSEVIFNLLLLTLLNSSKTKMHVQLY